MCGCVGIDDVVWRVTGFHHLTTGEEGVLCEGDKLLSNYTTMSPGMYVRYCICTGPPLRSREYAIIVAKCPVFAGTVPDFGLVSHSCPVWTFCPRS